MEPRLAVSAAAILLAVGCGGEAPQSVQVRTDGIDATPLLYDKVPVPEWYLRQQTPREDRLKFEKQPPVEIENPRIKAVDASR